LLAFAVLFFHVFSYTSYAPWLDNIGPTGVNLFFAISGYLIFQSLTRHQSIRSFAMDRVLRIYPVFLVIHLLVFVIGPVVDYKWFANISVAGYAAHFLSNLLFLPGIFDLPMAQVVAWTLSYEAAFYVVMSLTFLFMRQKGNARFMLIIPSMMAVSVVYFHPDALFFAVGIAVSLYKDKLKIVGNHPFSFLNGLIFLILTYFTYSVHNVFVSLFFGFLFFITIANEQGLTSRLLRTKIMIFLGNISYSLYLWHTLVMLPLKSIVQRLSPAINNEFLTDALFSFAAICISIFVSYFSYLLLERKLTGFIKDKMKRKRTSNKSVPDAVHG